MNAPACHCGKNGYQLHSTACPVHGTDAMRDRFEYKIDTKKRMIIANAGYSEDAMQADLNDYGQDGWEVITIASAVGGGMQHTQFIMKRKIVGTSQ